tara:strand:- start:24 stop:1580 length:1557 start_codon:yes stop_codon:yes gene_type:complete
MINKNNMKKYLTLLSLVFTTNFLICQGTVRETLQATWLSENYFFVEFETNNEIFKYSEDEKPKSFVKLDSSQLFLSKKKKLNLFIKPLNPIRYKITTEKIQLEDKEYQEAQNALNQIMAYLSPLVGLKEGEIGTELNSAPEFQTLSNSKASNDQKKKAKIEILNKFKSTHLRLLKDIVEGEEKSIKKIKLIDFLSLDFLKKIAALETVNQFDFNKSYKDILNSLLSLEYLHSYEIEFEGELKKVKDSYDAINKKLNDGNNLVENFVIPNEMIENDYGYLNSGIYSLLDQTKEQNKEYQELSGSFNGLFKVLDEWLKKIKKYNGFYPIGDIKVTDGKIDGIQLKIEKIDVDVKESNLKYGPSKEFKEKITFKKFRRFVFEVRPGIAYVTNLSFPNYIVETNDEGQNLLAKGDDEQFDRLNLQVMLNANYNIENSPILPFLQIGVGPSTKYPIFFTGGGFRILERFNISFGGAWTWINELDELSVGEIVDDQAQIEDDLSFQFTNKPRFYIGLQMAISEL